MSFPTVLKQVWHMDNSDLNVVGEHLGYTWNQVCDEVGKAGFYAEDGDGSFTVTRNKENSYADNEVIDAIMTAIFANHPDVRVIRISN